MVKTVPKTLSLVVTTIRNLSEIQGCTTREIMNYINSEYGIAETTVKRQMQAVMKRCLAYGILKCVNGRYSLTSSRETAPADVGLTDKSCKRKRRVGKCSKKKRNLGRNDRSHKHRPKRQHRHIPKNEDLSHNHADRRCHHDTKSHLSDACPTRSFTTDACSSSGASDI